MQDDDTRSRRLDAQADRRAVGWRGELVTFLLENKKWWLAPILVMFLAVGVLLWLADSAVTPLVYPLF